MNFVKTRNNFLLSRKVIIKFGFYGETCKTCLSFLTVIDDETMPIAPKKIIKVKTLNFYTCFLRRQC